MFISQVSKLPRPQHLYMEAISVGKGPHSTAVQLSKGGQWLDQSNPFSFTLQTSGHIISVRHWGMNSEGVI